MSKVLFFASFMWLSTLSYAVGESKTIQLDQALQSIQEELQIPALAVAVIDGGELIYANGFGYSDRSKSKLVTENTLFRVASITKLFTAQATMQLVEENKLSLEDSVSSYIPEIKDRRITVKSLLTHTSGLVDSAKPVDSKRSFKEYISQTLTDSEPGIATEFIYADANYNVLGEIIAVITGGHYTDYVQENIFDPLGINKSGFNTGSGNVTPDLSPFLNFGLVVNAPRRPYDPSFAPSEGLITSARELAVWTQAVLNHNEALLSTASFSEMLIPRHKTSWGDIQIGLGWQIYHENEQLVAQHAGSITGFKSLLLTNPERKRAIIILTNAQAVPRWDISRAINAIIDERDFVQPASHQTMYKCILLAVFSSVLFVSGLSWRRVRKGNKCIAEAPGKKNT